MLRAQRVGKLGNWDWDIVNEMLIWSDEVYRIFGQNPETFELTYNNIVSFIHPDDRVGNAQTVQNILLRETFGSSEFWIILPDGSVKNIQQHYEVTRDAKGNAIRAFGVMQDVTELNKLAREKELFARLLNNVPDYIYFKDKDSKFIRLNPKAAEALGTTPDEGLGKSDADFFPDIAEKAREQELKIIQTGVPQVDDPIEISFADGTKHWVSVTKVPFKNQKGEIEGIIGISRDICREKQAEQAVRESETLLRTIIDSSPNCIFVKDYNGRYLLVNKAIAALYGTSSEEMLGKTDLDFAKQLRLKPTEAQKFLEDDRTAIEHKKSVFVKEESFSLPDGATRWFQTAKIHLSVGRYQNCILGNSVEISERKIAEIELKNKTAELDELFRALPNALVYADTERRIKKVNPAFEKIFGYTESEVLGRHTSMLYTSNDSYIEQGNIRYNISARDLYTPYEIEYRRKNGDIFPSESVGTPVLNAQGELTGFIGLVQDISERKLAEDALKRSEKETKLMLHSMLNAFVLFESVFDQNGNFTDCRFLYVNDCFEKILGVKNQEVKGKTIHEIYPETEPKWIERYGEVALTGKSQTFDLYHGPTQNFFIAMCIAHMRRLRKFVSFLRTSPNASALNRLCGKVKGSTEPWSIIRLKAFSCCRESDVSMPILP
ncbi:PAS domain S-box protein [candidate division KSB1 bacterium]|nr:PAS domain S-box protein [candidate division KSB1 bacterium]